MMAAIQAISHPQLIMTIDEEIPLVHPQLLTISRIGVVIQKDGHVGFVKSGDAYETNERENGGDGDVKEEEAFHN